MTTWKHPKTPGEWKAWLRERLLADSRVKDRRHVAYILATVEHETRATFNPAIKEGYDEVTDEQRAKYPTGTPTRFIYFEEEYGYLTEKGRKKLGNTTLGDGVRYAGRGLVQVTGRRNYELFGKRLNLDLLTQPDLVHVPDNAYEILVIGMMEGEFTGRRLTEFIYQGREDWANARRTVNGIDHAAHIADLAKKELARLQAL